MKVVITARNFDVDGGEQIKRLKAHGFEVVDYSDRMFDNEDDYFEALRGADAVINAIEPMSRKGLLDSDLKLISVRGVGYDYIDSDACREKGIAISRTVGAVEGAVAEQVMAYLLYFARRIDFQNSSMQGGKWERLMSSGLSGMTLGIIGLGGIGIEIAKRALPFGMKIVYFSRTKKDFAGVDYLELDELLSVSDYVALSLPLTPQSEGMIGDRQLSLMKKSAVLINVSRAKIVDVYALKEALEKGELGGCAIDVFEKEPCTDSPLIGLENAVLTPHTSPYTKNNFIAMNKLATDNIIRFFDKTIDEKYLV